MAKSNDKNDPNYNPRARPNNSRPSIYKPEFCDTLLEVAAEGKSITAFCAQIGIHRDTFYDWGRKHSDFSDAIKKARTISQQYWEDVLAHSVHDQKVNTTSLIFLMKNRFEDYRA